MTPGQVRVLLIGNAQDPHASAVLDRLPRAGTVLVDVTTVTDVALSVRPTQTVLRDADNSPVSLEADTTAIGWLRRLGPAGWDDGAELGSHAAAVLAARLTLLAGLVHHPSVTWVTPMDANTPAENKLVQYRAAHHLGLRVPQTIVATDLDRLVAALGPTFVLKPLGPGGYRDAAGTDQVVYARAVHADDLTDADLSRAIPRPRTARR